MMPALREVFTDVDDAGEAWLGPLIISASYGVPLVVVREAMATGELPTINRRAHEADVHVWREQLDAARIERHTRLVRLRLIKRRVEARTDISSRQSSRKGM